jgi:hypothetical protein
MTWTKKKWDLASNKEESDDVRKLNAMLEDVPIEDMIAGGPQALGTDDLVLCIRLISPKEGKFTFTVGPREGFIQDYRGLLNPTWAQCHPSDPSLHDPPGSRAIWVAFVDDKDRPVYLTREITVSGAPGGEA